MSALPGARGARGGPPVTYLDHAAATPVRPEAARAMAPFLDGRFGNPNGGHRVARQARQALEEAREVVARHLGTGPSQVVFTSGGTEADALAVWGTLARATARPVVVCSAVEHPAVLEACRAAAGRRPGPGAPGGADLVMAPVGPDGAVDLGRLDDLLAGAGPVVLVSVMTANNEVGTIQDIPAVARLVRERCPEAVLHTDAVQAAGWLNLVTATAGADLVAISGHKVGGPGGTGALALRHDTTLVPLVPGGGQEQGRRGGTQDVAGAVGLAAALDAAARDREAQAARVRALRDRLADGLVAAVPGCTETVPRDRVLPGHCHLRFAGVDREELLVLLDAEGVCASGGAACASGALEPSHVLAAMGLEDGGALRLTLGHTTASCDVDRALAVVPAAVARLRG